MKLIHTLFDTEDLVVACISVDDEPYCVYPDPNGDCTRALQKALDDCWAHGGGTVYIPAGDYRLTEPIVIPAHVTLRGDYHIPDGTGNMGTVLHLDVPSSDIPFPATIRMVGSSGLRGITIYYPRQTLADPLPYPYAIGFPVRRDKMADFMSFTVDEITLLNAYRGIEGSLHGEKDAHELHFISRVIGTPLDTGMHIQNCSDTGRAQHVSFSADWWANAGSKYHAPDIEELRRYMLGHTHGILYGDSEWENIYDIEIKDCQVGFSVVKGPRIGPLLEIFDLRISNCELCLNIEEVDGRAGIEFAQSSFETTGKPNSLALRITDPTDGASLFNQCHFSAGQGRIGHLLGTHTAVLQACDLGTFGTAEAILQEQGGLLIEGCAFETELTGSAWGITSLKSSTGVMLRAVQAKGDQLVRGDGTTDIDTRGFAEFPRIPVKHPGFTGRIAPKRRALCVVSAPNDATEDASAAIQEAMDEMARCGGGVVLLPAGQYRLDNDLVVPSGVELRGVDDSPHQGAMKGSTLYIVRGKNDPHCDSAPAAITMKDNSGLRGLNLYYPDYPIAGPVVPEDTQDEGFALPEEKREKYFSRFCDYPYSIRGDGERIYIVYVTLVNTCRGIDLSGQYSAPCHDHYLRYVRMFAMKTGICVGNTREGWIENCNYQLNDWCRGDMPRAEHGGLKSAALKYQQYHSDMLRLGNCQNEHVLNNALYGAMNAYRLVSQNGQGPEATFINCPADGVMRNILCEATGPKGVSFANVVLCVLVPNEHASHSAIEVHGGELHINNALALGFNLPHLDHDGENLDITDGRLVLCGLTTYLRSIKAAGGHSFVSGALLTESPKAMNRNGLTLTSDYRHWVKQK